MTDKPTPQPPPQQPQQRNLFEFFDEEARTMMGHARDEVVRTKRISLEAEHLLGALLVANFKGIDEVLAGAKVDAGALRGALDEVCGLGDAAALPEQLQVGAGAQQALQVALQAAGQMFHGLVKPEHVLLGLIQAADGPAAKALAKIGTTRDVLGASLMRRIQTFPQDEAAKKRVLEAQRAQAAAQARAGGAGAAGGGGGGGALSGFTESATRVVSEARRLAGELRHGQVGTVHLLLALLNDQDRLATNAFLKVGVRAEDVKNELLRQLRAESAEPVKA
jgi:ATP-dependent Clp protease ATP-binding subunit ClpC